ncbi:MAG: 30S ribosomal protein S6 [Elusimicrobia bacterium RIFOXYA2_FULL_39_19]|nr:MAG: 30S ribosomal protein S6 [Elusimicrobia bacterium RIFOXYA2_FULL_39_19]
MNRYDTIFICKPDLPSEKISSLTEKVKSIITSTSSEIISVNEWGKRRLAYAISGYEDGYYVYIEYSSMGDAVNKVEDFYKITEEIFRYITVKKVEKKRKKPQPKPKEVKKEDVPNVPENKVTRTE